MTKGHTVALDLATQYTTWLIVVITFVAGWPIAQSHRHEKLHPLAAYLLFISVLALVSSPVFWILILIGSALFGPASLEGAGPAVVIVLIALVPGLAAGRWIVRRPQVRRMPK